MPGAVAPAQPVLRTVDDFLAWVERQHERYELARGQLVLMAGGSAAHNDIQVNLLTALRARLRGGPCRPNGPDLLLRIDDRTGRFPDASVTCGERGPNYLTRPVVLFEILSESSEARDRGEKRREYQRLPSLAHYVLIDQAVARVEVYTRSEGRWLFQEIEGLDATLPLDAIGVTLPLAELYDGVDLPAPGAEAAAGT
jgi:Uma2 family endonuclease